MNPYWLALALACYALSAASFVRRRMPVIGLYIAPIAIVALALGASTMRNARFSIPQGLRSVWPPTHVTFALLGCMLLVLAAVVSLVYLVYERRLKAKRFARETRQSSGP